MEKVIRFIYGGGLGNQLFQYAAMLYIEKNFPEVKITPDFGQYYYDCFHNGIGIQKIFHTDFAGEINKVEYFRKSYNKKESKVHRIARIAWYKLSRYKTFYNSAIITPNKMAKIIDNNQKMIFAGFFQNDTFASAVKKDLHRDLIQYTSLGTDNDRLLTRIKERDSISLHIRRGDYIGLPLYDIFNGTEYYQRAISYFKIKYHNPVFVIFSDDIPWVKENLIIGCDCEYVDWNNGEDSFKDLIVMSHCVHNIIANSSFSWWGAWLNQNPAKIVISPKKWFIGKPSDEVVPCDWLRFDN